MSVCCLLWTSSWIVVECCCTTLYPLLFSHACIVRFADLGRLSSCVFPGVFVSGAFVMSNFFGVTGVLWRQWSPPTNGSSCPPGSPMIMLLTPPIGRFLFFNSHSRRLMRAKRLCPGWEHSSVIASPTPSQNLSTIACLPGLSGSRILSALSHTLRWYDECIVRAPSSPDATPVNDAVTDIVGGCNSFALELMEWMRALLPVPASPNTVISNCLPLASVCIAMFPAIRCMSPRHAYGRALIRDAVSTVSPVSSFLRSSHVHSLLISSSEYPSLPFSRSNGAVSGSSRPAMISVASSAWSSVLSPVSPGPSAGWSSVASL